MRRSVDSEGRAAPSGDAGRAPSALRRLQGERGAAMVEFALVLPLLVLLIVGMLEFGRALNYWIDETHLANEAARYAAVNVDPGSSGGLTLQQWVRQQAGTPELLSGSSSVTKPVQVCLSLPVNPDTGTSGKLGDPVHVDVKATYHWLPLATLFDSPAWTDTELVGSATMRLETDFTGTAGCS